MNEINVDSREILMEILQGSTFVKVFRWGAATKTYKAITGITAAAPAVVTAPSHGVPNGWPVRISAVSGMDDINDGQWHDATVLTSSTMELNDVNAADFDAYVSGGVVEYHTPIDLASCTARADIRSSIGATDPLLTLTTENGGIVLDDTAKTITLAISAAATTALTWRTGVYDLEIVDGAGVVTRIAAGGVSVSREVTR